MSADYRLADRWRTWQTAGRIQPVIGRYRMASSMTSSSVSFGVRQNMRSLPCHGGHRAGRSARSPAPTSGVPTPGPPHARTRRVRHHRHFDLRRRRTPTAAATTTTTGSRKGSWTQPAHRNDRPLRQPMAMDRTVHDIASVHTSAADRALHSRSSYRNCREADVVRPRRAAWWGTGRPLGDPD
jgi:hypothetical protein